MYSSMHTLVFNKWLFNISPRYFLVAVKDYYAYKILLMSFTERLQFIIARIAKQDVVPFYPPKKSKIST